MPKIDKEALYNQLASWERDLFTMLDAVPKDANGENVTERLLLMRQLSTVSICKFIVHDFPELQEEGYTDEIRSTIAKSLGSANNEEIADAYENTVSCGVCPYWSECRNEHECFVYILRKLKEAQNEQTKL